MAGRHTRPSGRWRAWQLRLHHDRAMQRARREALRAQAAYQAELLEWKRRRHALVMAGWAPDAAAARTGPMPTAPPPSPV